MSPFRALARSAFRTTSRFFRGGAAVLNGERPEGDQRFPRSDRLLRPAEFERVYKRRRSAADGVLLVFACGQGLNDYFIQPRFLGDRVGLPAVWVIFALFAGGAAFGFLGIMLAVPVTATLGVLARFWLRRYLHSSLYLDAPPD